MPYTCERIAREAWTMAGDEGWCAFDDLTHWSVAERAVRRAADRLGVKLYEGGPFDEVRAAAYALECRVRAHGGIAANANPYAMTEEKDR